MDINTGGGGGGGGSGYARLLQHLAPGRSKRTEKRGQFDEGCRCLFGGGVTLETRGTKTAETKSVRSEEKKKSDQERSSGSAGSEGTKSKRRVNL